MPGNACNGLPTISAPLLNAVTLLPPFGMFTNPTPGMLLAADTESGMGVSPQTVAATAFQIAAFAAELIVNTATSTAHAATLNTKSGMITTEALTTAPGATYVFTLTDSLLIAGAPAPQVVIRDGSNSGGVMQVTSVVNATGSTVITFTNIGTTALNGTMLIAFHV